MRSSLKKYIKHRNDENLFCVLTDGEIVTQLESKHKFKVVKAYKTERGAKKMVNKIKNKTA